MSEGAVPLGKVGARESETSARHGSRTDFQRVGILQHRLSQPIIQRSCQKGICAQSFRGRRQIFEIRISKDSFVGGDKASGEEAKKRSRMIISTAAAQISLQRGIDPRWIRSGRLTLRQFL